jgi:trk system potassium uptake protein TrkA
MSQDAHHVVVIDKDESAFDRLSAEYSGFRVEGDATEFAVLKQAKIDDADLVIAAAREDNVNLMVAQIARKLFRVRRVMARVFDPQQAEIYRDFGIEAICPTSLAGDIFLQSLGKSPALNEEGNAQ